MFILSNPSPIFDNEHCFSSSKTPSHQPKCKLIINHITNLRYFKIIYNDGLKFRQCTFFFNLFYHDPVVMKPSCFTNDLLFVISLLQFSKRNEFVVPHIYVYIYIYTTLACFMFMKTVPVCGDVNGRPLCVRRGEPV